MSYKKVPAIHGFGFRRKCIKGIYFPRMRNPFRANTNKNRKWFNDKNKNIG